jgi:hypothetical protein
VTDPKQKKVDDLEQVTTDILKAYQACDDDSAERVHLVAAQAHVDRARRARARRERAG